MWIKNTMLGIAVSTAILGWTGKCTGNDNIAGTLENSTKIELNEAQDSTKTDTIPEQIFVCLDTDEKGSYTYTKTLESIENPENTILEYPVDPLFQKYWESGRPHPLRPWVAKNFRALLWRWWIEASDIPQKLKPRENAVTSETAYEVWDTLRFALIDTRLKWAFPDDLSEQLKEIWFEKFSDKDSLEIISRNKAANQFKKYPKIDNQFYYWNPEQQEEKSLDNWYIYDILVKSLPWWKSALAVYRDWKLFMATYASVWTLGHKTRTWQHEIIGKNPYKRSIKYDNSAMPFALNYSWWFYIHQWNVSWYPLSHWCVRLPWVYANILYSLVQDKEHVDVFIDENLYKSK